MRDYKSLILKFVPVDRLASRPIPGGEVSTLLVNRQTNQKVRTRLNSSAPQLAGKRISSEPYL